VQYDWHHQAIHKASPSRLDLFGSNKGKSRHSNSQTDQKGSNAQKWAAEKFRPSRQLPNHDGLCGRQSAGLTLNDN
jgi:hypothetical protein